MVPLITGPGFDEWCTGDNISFCLGGVGRMGRFRVFSDAGEVLGVA